jgi:UDP-glucose 4-epimerase
MKQKYLITGGAGFIGTNVVETLVAEGHEVVVVDDLSAGDAKRLPPTVAFHQLDIRDTAALTELCRGIDIIVHLAALPRVQFSIDEPVVTYAVNVTGTVSVLEAARSASVKRIVFAASSAVYGDQETLPLSINLPAQPKSPYALHKYIGEEMMRLWSVVYGVETVSLRFFNVYGPHLDPDGPYALVIGRFLKLAMAQEPLTITGDGEQTRDFVYVGDVVSAIVKASVSKNVGRGEVLNIGSGEQTSIKDLALMISSDCTHVPARLEPKHTVADISLTQEYLSWQPTITLEVGIEKLKHDWGLTAY